MTEAEAEAGAEGDEPKPTRRQMGFRRSATPKLAPDAARRQGAVTRLAFTLLGDKDRAITYLNTDHSALGGRPLDLATASEAGLSAVEQDIRALAGNAPGSDIGDVVVGLAG